MLDLQYLALTPEHRRKGLPSPKLNFIELALDRTVAAFTGHLLDCILVLSQGGEGVAKVDELQVCVSLVSQGRGGGGGGGGGGVAPRHRKHRLVLVVELSSPFL